MKTEAACMGISEDDDPLYVLDVYLPDQTADAAYVEFDDHALAGYIEDLVELGWQPRNVSRIWMHTHPQGVNRPSAKDEDTFQTLFGNCDWAIMAILPKGGQPYARLSVRLAEQTYWMDVPCQIDWSQSFEEFDADKFESLAESAISRTPIQGAKWTDYYRGYFSPTLEPSVKSRTPEDQDQELLDARLAAAEPPAKSWDDLEEDDWKRAIARLAGDDDDDDDDFDLWA